MIERSPTFFEHDAAAQLSPRLHELQIEEAERRRIARQLRENERLEQQALSLAHRRKAVDRDRHQSRVARRIDRYLRKQQEKGKLKLGRGIRRPVWCVELALKYYSICQAARFISRTASNIGQSIRSKGKVKCGGYTWEVFDPTRHKPTSARPSASATVRPSPAADTAGR